MQLSLRHKLGAGYLIMAAALLFCAVAGFTAANSLSSTLNYVTTSAWDAADGAMEGTIEIEAEMLALSRILSGSTSIEDGKKEMASAAAGASEALGRMAGSGLMAADAVTKLQEYIEVFGASRDKIIVAYSDLQLNQKTAAENLAEIDANLYELEEIIETIAERKQAQNVSAEEILPYWNLADAIMETRLSLLGRSHSLNRILRGTDAEVLRVEMESDLALAQEQSQDMSKSSFSRQKNDKGVSFGVAVAELLPKHKTLYADTIASYQAFVQAKQELELATSQLLDLVAEIEEAGDSKIEGVLSEIDATIAFADSSILASAVLGIVLAVIAFIYSIRAVIKPVRDIAGRLTSIGEEGGDLTQRLTINGNDEIADLSLGFNNFIDKVHITIKAVLESSNHVSTSANNLSSITHLANQGAEQQKNETVAIAAAVEEMSGSLDHVDESAVIAAREAGNADSSANKGKDIVGQTINGIHTLSGEVVAAVGVINNLEEQAESIGSVLDVIRGIAEQTNLLALNAAIEAARAGEQGRGFAVVADEVRTLASRTQESTEEIQAMIQNLQTSTKEAVSVMDKSQKQAEATVELASTAGQALDEIAMAVSKISDMNNQIAHAAEEQKTTGKEVASNVAAIQVVAETTADNSLQAQNNSSEVLKQAAELQAMMAQFKT